MGKNITFSMIKPDAMEQGFAGDILAKIVKAGFKVKALKMTHLSKRDAENFYEIHRERPFFDELVAFMSRSPIIALVLEKENAVNDFREFIGTTNPSEAHEGSIRKLYGTSVGENAVHGSDSDENAQIEVSFHFSAREIY